MVIQSEVATDWQSRGFNCLLWTDSPGQKWENFRHDVDELVMVMNGNVEFMIGEKLHQPSPGEELLIPAGVIHSVRNIGNTTSNWLYGYRQSRG